MADRDARRAGRRRARSQDPDRDMRAPTGNGLDRRVLFHVGKVAVQFDHIPRKALLGRHVTAKSSGRRHVRAGRTPEAEVDPIRIERRQGPELFCHDEGRMIGQHDPARADAHCSSGCGNMADDNRRRSAGDPGHVVMFGQPVAVITRRFGGARQSTVLVSASASAPPSGTGDRSSRE